MNNHERINNFAEIMINIHDENVKNHEHIIIFAEIMIESWDRFCPCNGDFLENRQLTLPNDFTLSFG